MKQTMRSYNSTLRPRSAKELALSGEYALLLARLEMRAGQRCEWCGAAHCENHHIDGRNDGRRIDPFNIIRLCRKCHTTFQAHNSWEVRQALQAWVRPIRLAQGFTALSRAVEEADR